MYGNCRRKRSTMRGPLLVCLKTGPNSLENLHESHFIVPSETDEKIFSTLLARLHRGFHKYKSPIKNMAGDDAPLRDRVGYAHQAFEWRETTRLAEC